jgi:alkylation response protein AidB-like acyl-CoA dehydrogenase
MRVSLSSEQEALRSTTARFLDDHAPLSVVRGLRHDAAGFEPDYWTRGAELGWTSLLVSEARGGGSVSGRPVGELCLIAHEFGTHAAPGPLVPTNIVAAALDRSDNPEHLALLDELMAGTAIATWCYSEPPPNDGVSGLEFEVRLDGNELVLNGVKRPVESAGSASHFLVTGRTGNGITQVVVPAEASGLTVTPLESADLTRRFAAVRFDDVRVPADAAVGPVGEAATAVERQLQVAIVAHNAEAVGSMQRAFDMTRSWLADRYSFGRPLESYQAIKHRFADLLSWLEASHAISDAAAEALDAGSPDAAELVSAAKAYIGHYGAELLQDCVHLHGGIGVTFEHDLHLFLRRVTVNRALFGTPAQHQRHVGELASQRKPVGEATA